MIPIPPDATTQDIEQWCSRGVVIVKNGERETPAFFRGVISGTTLEVMPLDSGDVEHVLRTAVFVHWPRCGSVNIRGAHYAVHAARVTQRQYRRTWFPGGLSIITPRAWDVAKFLGSSPDRMSVQPRALAASCFAPTYYTMDEAETLLSSGSHLSVAISPHIIVAGDPDGKRIFYFNGELAATASNRLLYPIGDEIAVRRVRKAVEGSGYGSFDFGT